MPHSNNEEQKILDLMDQYFATASKEEIARDVEYINSLGTNGITFEQYLTDLSLLNEDLHNLNLQIE